LEDRSLELGAFGAWRIRTGLDIDWGMEIIYYLTGEE